jgi:hypothetical protein
VYLWGGEEKSLGAGKPVEPNDSAAAPAPVSEATPAAAVPVETAPLTDSAVAPPPVHAPGANSDAKLAEDVANLHVQDGEAPKPVA